MTEAAEGWARSGTCGSPGGNIMVSCLSSRSSLLLPTLVATALLLTWSSLTARTIDDILVTAQRTEAGLQETPISITAFTGDQLRALEVQ